MYFLKNSKKKFKTQADSSTKSNLGFLDKIKFSQKIPRQNQIFKKK